MNRDRISISEIVAYILIAIVILNIADTAIRYNRYINSYDSSIEYDYKR